jgi:hypothetical protein
MKIEGRNDVIDMAIASFILSTLPKNIVNSPNRGHTNTVVVITWTLILDPGSWMLDFASLHCTAWIQPAIQTMSNHMHAYHRVECGLIQRGLLM